MIFQDLVDEAGSDFHAYIEEVRSDDPNATVDPEWREYAQRRFRVVANATQQSILGDMNVGSISQNLVGQCLNQIAGRLRFKDYNVEDANTKTVLDEFSTKNQMDRAVIANTKRTLTDGNTAMSVSWKGDRTGRPVIHHEKWWDGVMGMFVAVSDSGDSEWAVSEWIDRDENVFRTLYVDDWIIRYIREGQGWSMQRETKWQRPNGKPLGVPVAHFSNGASPYGPYGQSTVAAVMHAQDGLNASLFNRQLAVAFTGAQIYTATGMTPDRLVVRPGQLWGNPQEGGKFGVLPAGDLSGLHAETEDIRAIICGEFPVPSYRIGLGEWPSGLALQRSDAPMITQIKLLGDLAEPGLVLLAHRATEMINAFGEQEVNEDALITVTYAPTDETDPGTQTEIDQARAELYDRIVDLPPVLIRKLDLLEDKELTELLQWIEERDAELLAQQETIAQQGQQQPVEW